MSSRNVFHAIKTMGALEVRLCSDEGQATKHKIACQRSNSKKHCPEICDWEGFITISRLSSYAAGTSFKGAVGLSKTEAGSVAYSDCTTSMNEASRLVYLLVLYKRISAALTSLMPQLEAAYEQGI